MLVLGYAQVMSGVEGASWSGLRAIAKWLHQPPQKEITGWDAQASLRYVFVPLVVVWAAVPALLGLDGASMSVCLVVTAVIAWAWWVRTGRHWHPINRLRRRS